nr:Cullin-2 [Polyrhizophydium stewartii]
MFGSFREGLMGMYLFGERQVVGMDMYQQVYDICTARPKSHAEDLLQGIVQLLLEHTADLEESILDHDDIVSAYAVEWERFRTASDYANRVCDFLNRQFLKMASFHKSIQAQKVLRLSVEGHAFMIWKHRILAPIKRNHSNALIMQLMTLVRRERDGDQVPSDFIRAAIHSFVQVNAYSEQPLQLYVEEVETPYIANTIAYYMKESATVLSSMSISGFMAKALARLDEEAMRARRYCDPTSFEKVTANAAHSIFKRLLTGFWQTIQACEAEYIGAHQAKINSEFEKMIVEGRFEDCTRAYRLLSRITDGVNHILEVYEKFVARMGKETMSRFGASFIKDPREYVETMVEMHAKYMAQSIEVFKNEPAFIAAADKAHLGPGGQAPEIFARYCDLLLKKTPKAALSEQEADERLNKMIALFKYIDDKDVFQKFYSRALAKRLIHGLSISSDAELGMISRLKAHITLSDDIASGFKTFLDGSSVKLGPFAEKRYEFNMSLHQLSLILMFNDATTVKLADVRELTKLAHADIAKMVAPLVDLKLLAVTGQSAEDEGLSPEASLSLNMAFTSKRIKIKVPPGASAAEQRQESDSTHKSVDEDRKLYLQASIVRIMKARKEMTHTLLVGEVIDQARSLFSPSVPMIKRCIEQLIDKQYIERSGRDNYLYVA